MTVEQFLTSSTKTLRDAGVETARLDCLVLLEDVLGKDRARLLAHPETPIPSTALSTLNNYITQRQKHTPLAYIRGKASFFGREFIVNTNVLVPRPESEAMVELLKKHALPRHPRIADVGTGSGCIGITAALELPQAEVYLYDIDTDALVVATENSERLIQQKGTAEGATRVHVQRQDLLLGCTEQFNVVLANLPYVPEGYPVNRAAGFEPKLALFAGADGLDLYRAFWQQIASLRLQPRHVFTEALPMQHKPLVRLADAAGGYAQHCSQGMVQHFVRQ